MPRHSLATIVVLGVAVLALLSAYGPVQLSYVVSDSMEPTLETGDGYLIHRTTDVGEGDIVTFWSESKDQHVTHRIVDETDAGFVTKGDNNPSTDQAGGYPYVTKADVVGRVVTLGGDPIAVSYLGTVAAIAAQHRLVLAGAVVILLLLSMRERGARVARRTRRAVTVRQLVGVLLAVATVATAGALLAGDVSETVTYVVVEESRAANTLTLGDPAQRNETFTVQDTPLFDHAVGVEGATLERIDRTANETILALSIPPQDRRGPHEVTVTFARYPAVLPSSVVGGLYEVHAALGAVATALVVYLPMYLGYRLTLDGRAPIRLPRDRELRRWLQ